MSFSEWTEPWSSTNIFDIDDFPDFDLKAGDVKDTDLESFDQPTLPPLQYITATTYPQTSPGESLTVNINNSPMYDPHELLLVDPYQPDDEELYDDGLRERLVAARIRNHASRVGAGTKGHLPGADVTVNADAKMVGSFGVDASEGNVKNQGNRSLSKPTAAPSKFSTTKPKIKLEPELAARGVAPGGMAIKFDFDDGGLWSELHGYTAPEQSKGAASAAHTNTPISYMGRAVEGDFAVITPPSQTNQAATMDRTVATCGPRQLKTQSTAQPLVSALDVSSGIRFPKARPGVSTRGEGIISDISAQPNHVDRSSDQTVRPNTHAPARASAIATINPREPFAKARLELSGSQDAKILVEKRVPLTLQGPDDVAQALQNKAGWILDILAAMDKDWKPMPDNAGADMKAWRKWQHEQADKADSIVEKQHLSKQHPEACAWILFSTVLEAHQLGPRQIHRAGAAGPNTQLSCCERLHQIVNVLGNYAIVRCEVLQMTRLDELVANPQGFANQKVKYHTSNSGRESKAKTGAVDGGKKTVARKSSMKQDQRFEDSELPRHISKRLRPQVGNKHPAQYFPSHEEAISQANTTSAMPQYNMATTQPLSAGFQTQGRKRTVEQRDTAEPSSLLQGPAPGTFLCHVEADNHQDPTSRQPSPAKRFHLDPTLANSRA